MFHFVDLIKFDYQVTEELEKVKQEMDERGSSMTDGGELDKFTHKTELCGQTGRKCFI